MIPLNMSNKQDNTGNNNTKVFRFDTYKDGRSTFGSIKEYVKAKKEADRTLEKWKKENETRIKNQLDNSTWPSSDNGGDDSPDAA